MSRFGASHGSCCGNRGWRHNVSCINPRNQASKPTRPIDTVNLESELSKYINNNLEDCLRLEFILRGIETTSNGEINSSVRINSEEIEVSLDYPLTIKERESTLVISKFNSKFNSKFKNIYDASREIVESYSKNPGFICITCNEDISKKYGVEINALPIEDVSIFENNVIWFIIKNKGDFVDTDVFLRFIVEQ